MAKQDRIDSSDELIGVTGRRAARVVRISLKQLAGWEQNQLVVPRMHRVHGGRHVRTYGLPELVELSVVRQLHERGMAIPRIRRLVEAVRAEADHPLRQLRWAVEGRDMFVGFDDGGWVGGRKPRQGVLIDTINVEELRTVARRRATERDPDAVGKVERRSRTLGRKQVFAGTRTPLEAVQTYVERGAPTSEILEAFPHLSKGDVEMARREMIGA